MSIAKVTYRIGFGCLTALLLGGCAAKGRLPPFPDEWPVEGVQLEQAADVPSGELVPPGELAGNAPPILQPPATYPECLPPGGGPFAPAAPPVPNPLFVPVANYEAAWESIVNAVDDYFRIAREERVQLIGQVLTEGRIETLPQMGATLLEPHRPDSVGLFNRKLATYQTIRRIGVFHVMPAEGGLTIEAVVETQMEDLPRPEHATAGRSTLRSDTSLSSNENIDALPQRGGVWYPIGRDTALEQEILAQIRACLDVAPPGVVY